MKELTRVMVNCVMVLVAYLFIAWVNDYNKESMLIAFALIIMYDLKDIRDQINELKKNTYE